MTFYVKTNEGTHPKHPEMLTRAILETAEAAWAWVDDQSHTADGERTAFGLAGVVVVDHEGHEILGPSHPAVIYGCAKPYQRMER